MNLRGKADYRIKDFIRLLSEVLWALAIGGVLGDHVVLGAGLSGLKAWLNDRPKSGKKSIHELVDRFLKSIKKDLSRLDYDPESLRLSFGWVRELLREHADKPIAAAIEPNPEEYARLVCEEAKSKIPDDLKAPICRMIKIFYRRVLENHLLNELVGPDTVVSLSASIGMKVSRLDSQLKYIWSLIRDIDLEKYEQAHRLLRRPWLTKPVSSLGLPAITARSGVIPFESISAFQKLLDWTRNLQTEGVYIRALIGPGGSGKSRTAIELAKVLVGEGWVAGFWGKNSRLDALAYLFKEENPYTKNAPGILVVLDYANQRDDELRGLLFTLAEHALSKGKLVVLLTLGRAYPQALTDLSSGKLCQSSRGYELSGWSTGLCQKLRESLTEHLELAELEPETARRLFGRAYEALGELDTSGLVRAVTEKEAWKLISDVEVYTRRPLPLIIGALLAVMGRLVKPLKDERDHVNCDDAAEVAGLLEQAYCFEVNHRWYPELQKRFHGRASNYLPLFEELALMSSVLFYLERDEAKKLLSKYRISEPDSQALIESAELLLPQAGPKRIAALEPDPVLDLVLRSKYRGEEHESMRKVLYSNIVSILNLRRENCNCKFKDDEKILRFLYALIVLERALGKQHKKAFIDYLQSQGINLSELLNRVSVVVESGHGLALSEYEWSKIEKPILIKELSGWR